MNTLYKLCAYVFVLATLCLQHAVGQNNLVFGTNTVGTTSNFDYSISLNNTNAIAALQFDISYNDAVLSLETNHELSSRAANHVLGVSNPQPGIIRVVMYSVSNEAITGNSGLLITLKLKSKTLPGTFSINATNVVVSSPEQTALTATAESGTLTVNGSIMSIISSRVNFGRVPIGAEPSRTLAVSNPGNMPLILTGTSLINPFGVQDAFPIEIEPQTTSNITLIINTDNKYNSSETLLFLNNDPDPLRAIQTSVLSADVYAVNEIQIGSSSGEIDTDIEIPIFVDNMEDFTGFQFDLQIPENMVFVPNSITTSLRLVDHIISANLINPTTIRFLGFSASNTNFTGSDGQLFSFKLRPNVSSGTYPLNIANAILSHVTLGNIISDSYNGSISVNSPFLNLNTTNIDFGAVPITETRNAVVSLINNGNANLVVHTIVSNSTEVQVAASLPLTIAPGQTTDLNLTFTPEAGGSFSETISFRHNAADEQTLLLVTATKFSPNFVMIEDKIGTVGAINTVEVLLKNIDAVRAVQFDVSVPEGFSINIEDVTTTDRTNSFSAVGSELSSGSYRLILFSTSATNLNAGDGAILQLPVFIDNDVPNGEYEFDFTNTLISNNNSQNISSLPLEIGTITITETLTASQLDLESAITLHPNPSNTYIHLKTAKHITIEHIQMYNSLGNKVLNISENHHSINITNFIAGIYYLKINTPEGSLTKKIIKK